MRMIDADRLVKTIEKAQMESLKVNVLSLINDAPTVFTQEDIDNVLELAYISGQQHPERPKGKWKLVEHGKDIDLECPFCGYKRGNLSYGYTMEEVLKDIAEDDTMLTKFCEMCGADLRGDV